MQSFQHVANPRVLNQNYGGEVMGAQNLGQNTQAQQTHAQPNIGATAPVVNGTDVHLNSLKICFKQAANSLTQLYKQSTFSYNIAYQQGR